MNKTYRECAIDYIKNRRLCKGYVGYIVAQLKVNILIQSTKEWTKDIFIEARR